jgi:hypothetical protein
MDESGRLRALKWLHEAAAQAAQARDLVQKGEHVAALHALVETRRLNRRAVAALAGRCLRDKMEAARRGDQDERDAGLSELSRLMRFALFALCLACRRQIGRQLKEVEDV